MTLPVSTRQAYRECWDVSSHLDVMSRPKPRRLSGALGATADLRPSAARRW
ncbi:hypothetical protein L083_2575 [Actinoplanes sp. N902-109]|nr:hypothetical protein L083_2575 [Actinoplanes sp. N902-109]